MSIVTLEMGDHDFEDILAKVYYAIETASHLAFEADGVDDLPAKERASYALEAAVDTARDMRALLSTALLMK